MERKAEVFVHDLAVVEKGAALGAGVSVGPFCHVGADAALGDNVRLVSHVSVIGATTIGAGTTVYPQTVLGAPPQNMKHKGGLTTLEIGSNCIIREGVTMHAGTDGSRARTTVGDNGYFMAYSHVAHDCAVGDNVTFANGATLGGHCEIGDFVSIGGLTAVHQFVRVGHHAFLGGCSAIVGDVIPYGLAAGNRASLRGLNIIGMKRSGLPRPQIHSMRKAYRTIFDPSRPLSDSLARAATEFADAPPVLDLVAFLSARGKRQFCVPSRDGGADSSDEAAG